MRSFVFILLFCLTSWASAANLGLPGDTATEGDIVPAVASAIRAGDAQKLASYFAATIDLTVPGSEGTYSRSQAELIVKGFFSANPPSSFVIQHQGTSAESSSFCIGRMDSGDSHFRVYFLVKTINGTALITQLQFEEA